MRDGALTIKQKQYLDMYEQGKTNQEIATILGVNPKTVYHMLRVINERTGRGLSTNATKHHWVDFPKQIKLNISEGQIIDYGNPIAESRPNEFKYEKFIVKKIYPRCVLINRLEEVQIEGKTSLRETGQRGNECPNYFDLYNKMRRG